MTTYIARVCEEWTMKLEKGDTDGKWFLDWLVRSPTQSGRHLEAGWLAYRSLLSVYSPREIETAVEYFGGVGAQSLMIQKFFSPQAHQVGEKSPEAVAHLQRELPPTVQVREMDAYRDRFGGFPDLVGLDFGDFTARWTLPGEGVRSLLDDVFAADPKAVVLTDVACRFLHLQKDVYEKILGEGTCGDYLSYLNHLVGRFIDLYNYLPVSIFWDRWSTVIALVPRERWKSVTTAKTSDLDSPVGLEIL